MTEHNIFEKGENMNTFNDVEVLKALLTETSRSVYGLKKELGEKLGNGNVNYATLLRHINKLVNRGFVIEERGERKNGRPDRRETRKLLLGFKGLVYLILKENASEREARAITQRFFTDPTYKNVRVDYPAILSIGTSSIQKTFERMRARVNLEHYDEDYVRTLFWNILVENLLDAVIPFMEKHFPDERIERNVKKLRVKKELIKLRDPIRAAYFVYDHLKTKREYYADRISRLRPFIKAFEKAGVKP